MTDGIREFLGIVDDKQWAEIKARLDDLAIQSMLFDMDIDYMTLSLMPKFEDKTPKWLKAYKDKVHYESDNMPGDPEQGWA